MSLESWQNDRKEDFKTFPEIPHSSKLILYNHGKILEMEEADA